MSVMSIRIDDEKRKKLKTIASMQGKTMSSIVESLIDDYIQEYIKDSGSRSELESIMKASEPSFDEWDNDEDEIYNDL
jgi:predicted DNA-binding protein